MHAPLTNHHPKLPDFSKMNLIKKGEKAEVYIGKHPITGQKIAIKRLLPQTISTPALRECMIEEVRATLELSHPNIIHLFDVTEDGDGSLYITMEHLEGPTLKELMEDTSLTLSLQDKCALLIQLADAIQFAHQQGVVHRTIKPSNILFKRRTKQKNGADAEGSTRSITRSSTHFVSAFEPVLVDFGMAELSRPNFIKTLHRLGAPVYQSPEQLKGRSITTRCDWFSFGSICFEWLYGEHYYGIDSYHQVKQKLQNELEQPNRAKSSDTEALLACLKWVRQLVEEAPEKRMDSFIEIKFQIESTVPQRHQTVKQKHFSQIVDSPINRMNAFTIRTLMAVLLPIALVIVLIATTAKVGTLLNTPADDQPSSNTSTSNSSITPPNNGELSTFESTIEAPSVAIALFE